MLLTSDPSKRVSVVTESGHDRRCSHALETRRPAKHEPAPAPRRINTAATPIESAFVACLTISFCHPNPSQTLPIPTHHLPFIILIPSSHFFFLFPILLKTRHSVVRPGLVSSIRTSSQIPPPRRRRRRCSTPLSVVVWHLRRQRTKTTTLVTVQPAYSASERVPRRRHCRCHRQRGVLSLVCEGINKNEALVYRWMAW